MRKMAGFALLALILITMGFASPLVSAAEKKQVITYWTFIDPKATGPRSAVLKTIIDEFEKKYPDIDVNVEVIPWQEIDNRLIQAVAAGKGPDVAHVDGLHLAQHVSANTIIPLDKYVIDWPKSIKADFIYPWETSVFKGRKMAMPLEHRVSVMYYRKDILKAAGIAVPKTWDEFVKACTSLTKVQTWGTAISLSRTGYASGVREFLFSMLPGLGGQLLTKDGKASFNDKHGIEAAQLIYNLVHKYKVMPPGVAALTFENVMEGFIAGTYTMYFQGSHRYGHIKSIIGDKVGVSYIPSNNPKKPSPGHIWGWMLTLPRTGKQPDVAWKFIDFMTNEESQFLRVKLSGELPTRKSILNNPWFSEKDNEDIKFFLKYMSDYGYPMVYPPALDFLTDSLAVALQDIVVNNVPIKKTLDEAAVKYNKEAGF